MARFLSASCITRASCLPKLWSPNTFVRFEKRSIANSSILFEKQPNILAQNFSENAKQQKEQLDQAFKQSIRQMTGSKRFIFNDYVRDMKTAMEQAKKSMGTVGKIRNFLSGKPEELKDLESLVAMHEHFNAEERLAENVRFFTAERRQAFLTRCAQAKADPPVTLERLNEALLRFDSMTRLHAYVHERIARRLPLPDNQIQLEAMMRDQPAKPPQSVKMNVDRGRPR